MRTLAVPIFAALAGLALSVSIPLLAQDVKSLQTGPVTSTATWSGRST